MFQILLGRLRPIVSASSTESVAQGNQTKKPPTGSFPAWRLCSPGVPWLPSTLPLLITKQIEIHNYGQRTALVKLLFSNVAAGNGEGVPSSSLTGNADWDKFAGP
jgi:hypothetical protein